MRLRTIVVAVALFCAVIAPAQAQKTKTVLTTEIDTNWPDNVVGAITPALLRSTVLDILNSYYDLNGGTSLTCAAHQWIAGLPTLSSITCTQPGFSDISGQAALTQLPTIGADTVLCSIAGGTPIACTQTQITALINLATASLPGALPAWPNNTTTYFRGDGTYATLNLAAISGFGTGVATALGIATNTSGGFPIYNVGTWTPTLTGVSSGSATLSTAVGSYEQIGRSVTARFVVITSNLNAFTGGAQIGNLPFTVTNTANDTGGCFISFWSGLSLSTGFVVVSGQPVQNSTNALLIESGGTTTNSASFGAAQMTATSHFEGTCHYHT